MNLDRIISVQNSITVYRDGDRCVKVFNPDCAKADVLNEALNQARMEQTTVTVPEIREVRQVNGKWAIVSEYIKGENLEQLIAKHPEKTGEYMALFASLHCRIHQQSCPAFKKLKDELQRGINASELQRNINSSELSATDRYDLYSRLERIPKYNEVCHGNFIPSKVIISAETGKPYIIDWFHATQGNAAADAALTYLLLRMRSRHDLAEQYLTLFCEKSGIEPQHIRRWIPLVAASQAGGANARGRAVLQQWIDAPEKAGEIETEVNFT